jgi:hypothetical protein
MTLLLGRHALVVHLKTAPAHDTQCEDRHCSKEEAPVFLDAPHFSESEHHGN